MLKSIPASSEFWIAVHHGLQHLTPYPVEYALRDPYQYGAGVPEGVFAKILDGMVSGALDEVATVRAISAFSTHCTEEEWTSWYRPVLEKRLRLPLTVTEFNKACPKEYRITENPTLPAMLPVAKADGLPQEFVLEPYSGAERILVLLQGKSTYVFQEDGTPVHRMLPKVFERFASPDGVVLDVYEEDERYVARDILMWDQFREEGATAPVDTRLRILSDMLAGQEALSVVEYSVHDGTTDAREDIAMAIQCGYPGVIFRMTGAGFWHDHANILIHPKRKSVLTCTRIDAGKDDTKYNGRTEFLWGSGRMDKKTFESPVFHGLTFTERETILQGRDEYKGRRFDVLSCGLDPSGKLIFPIFKQWKE